MKSVILLHNWVKKSALHADVLTTNSSMLQRIYENKNYQRYAKNLVPKNSTSTNETSS